MRSRAASGFLMININKNKDSDMFVVARTVLHSAAALRKVFLQSVCRLDSVGVFDQVLLQLGRDA